MARIPALTTLALLLASGSLLMSSCASVSAARAEDPYALVWADEFDGDSIDPAKWEHQVFPGVGSGNRELQHYTNRPVNSFVADGKLVIVAMEEDHLDHAYTSARLHTAERFAFRYGRVEARIKIPSTKGIWPAFWMMPEKSVYGGWPRSGEIDIMESVNVASHVHGTIHFGAPRHQYHGASLAAPEGTLWSDDFHVYSVEWEPNEMRWYVDGKHFSTQTEWETDGGAYPAPFDQEFHLLLNVAVGGNWPGSPDETSEFPQRMEVDWVRVYQIDNQAPVVRSVTLGAESPVPAGEDLVFEVEASDPDGQLEAVELVWRGEVVDRATSAPYRLVFPDVEDGCHDVMIKAIDDMGWRDWTRVSFKAGIGCPQLPFGDEPLPIPGIVEAENFDRGIEGEAYHDRDASNNGGAARRETGVDVGSGPDGRVTVGWMDSGEWLEYTVNVKRAGTYRLSAVGASAWGGGEIVLEAGEQRALLALSHTGGWDSFQEFQGEPISLPGSEQVLRLFVEDGGINLDQFRLDNAGD